LNTTDGKILKRELFCVLVTRDNVPDKIYANINNYLYMNQTFWVKKLERRKGEHKNNTIPSGLKNGGCLRDKIISSLRDLLLTNLHLYG